MSESDAVRVYGASDDLIEIEGRAQGCDEYNGEDERFLLIGPTGRVRLRVTYTHVWSITVAPLDEDVPMLAVSFEPIRSGYSARAVVEGVDLVVHEADARA